MYNSRLLTIGEARAMQRSKTSPVLWEPWERRSRHTLVFFEEPQEAFSLLTILQMCRNYASGIVMTWFRSTQARRAAGYAVALALFTAAGACAQTPAPAPTLEQALQAEIDQFVRADSVNPPAPCQVLFVGSSSIVLWETLATDMAPLPVINRGFGGSHIEYVNRWFDQIVAPYRPRAIVFYAGENDVAAGKSVDRVVADFETFLAQKTAVLGPTPVYFISLKPSKLRFAQLPLQRQVNEAIRRRAKQRADIHYIDVASSMLHEGRPKDLFVADRLHMNPQGYALWTRAVRAALLLNPDVTRPSCAPAERS